MVRESCGVDAVPANPDPVLRVNEVLLTFLHVIGHHHFRREPFQRQPIHCTIDVVPAGSDAVIVIPNHDVLLNRHDPVHVI